MIDQQEALRLINDEGYTAAELVSENCPSLLRRYRRNITALAQTMPEMRQHFPDMNIYVASGTLCLMIGDSHNDAMNCYAQRELVVDADNKINIDGGDW